MTKKITLRRIFHRGKWCIGIVFDFDGKLNSIVRSIDGSTFSSTNRCYYVDDNEANLKLILNSLKSFAEIDISAIVKQERPSKDFKVKPDTVTGFNKSPACGPGKEDNFEDNYQPDTIRLVIRNTKEMGDNEVIKRQGGYGPVEFRISEQKGLLVIKFLGRYDPEWIDEMKTYGTCYYDWKRKEWLLDWTKFNCDSFADYFAGRRVAVNIKKEVVDQELKSERKSTGNDIRAKELGKNAAEGLAVMLRSLEENRYSRRTIESYLAMLEFFFRYFSPKDPFEITEEEISRFIYDFIIRLGYSSAYQNQMVSAIKTFYTISGKGRVDPEFFERPRRRRALPKVFSKDEVTRILNSPRHMKHKLILWMIYSCGLRRSEVTNLRLPDLDRERNLIHIREGKGRIDRIVPLSEKLWGKLDEYLSGYKPREYLIEGQTGGKYSPESVYRIFKDAMLRAGIKKDVGVHSLRHSYATHLHESGLDIRYIQELLGHKSSRTTEIYTHVSRRNLIAVRSPIEDLDLK